MTISLPIKIAGLGRYLPERIVGNTEVETLCQLPAGWIEAKTGIRERRWINGETNSFMAAQAAQEAIAQAEAVHGSLAAELLDFDGLRVVKRLPPNGKASSEAAE